MIGSRLVNGIGKSIRRVSEDSRSRLSLDQLSAT
jgi:hypothetical protein